MKSRNTTMYKIIIFLFLFLFATNIFFQNNIYGVYSVQENQDSLSASINHEYQNTSDGNKNLIIYKSFRFTHNNSLSTCADGILFLLVSTFGIIRTIQSCELYIYNHKYSLKNSASLVSKKIRLNN
jgi:uncharacterized membrane protein SpoIIM required for sporulation